MPLDCGLRGKLFSAEVHGLFLAGLGVCVTVFPSRLVIGSRHPPQIATLITLPSEFQGCCSCLVTSARSVVFDFIPCSSHELSELRRKRQRFPTLKAGICRCRAFVSRVFQCIPRTSAASCRSISGSNIGREVGAVFGWVADSISVSKLGKAPLHSADYPTIARPRASCPIHNW
jgi:hypothetical protein